ncbi:sigma-70 family RNA polymerase sigma factor [Paenibacillus sp. RC67]|uniref:RNA polymerase sigma factor n=1 Tax=Paenibacillus sp. RC67 TaxID=3039392 RepID=UPI0024AD24FE|nr:sigma-70 family RNA polymerase sigma factor [Paenibacillus sp. RC67]
MKPRDKNMEHGEQLLDDAEIADRARMGDMEAFGELIQRHRDQAVGWAKKMAQDSGLAEDITQEAFIKAFLHVGRLVHPDRFVMWLRQIVKNEAHMKLRRGGPYGREMPISSLVIGKEHSDPDSQADVLERLIARRNDEHPADAEPQRALLRKEWLHLFRSLLPCLNERERGMFDAYFFMQLSAGEVAERFGTTSGSVHTYLYRSKAKIQKRALEDGQPFGLTSTAAVLRKNSLSMPTGVLDVKVTYVDRMSKLLRARGEGATAADLMGRSGHAFRLKISKQNTYADGIFLFDWKQEISKLVREYGYEAVYLTGQLEGTPVPIHQVAMLFEVVSADEPPVMQFIRRFVDCGCPVLFFDTYVKRPYVYEWNLIYSYNDLDRTVELTDITPPYRKTLTYEELSASPLRFFCGLQKTGRIVKESDLGQLLQIVVRQARENENDEHICGIRAYDQWIRHLESGPRLANPYGHRYLAHTCSNARAFAGRFVRSLATNRHEEVVLEDAAALYDEAAGYLKQISAAAPLLGEYEWTADTLRDASEWLGQAQQAEEQAVRMLEEYIQLLKLKNTKQGDLE